MNNGAKIALALLGVGLVGFGVYYVTQQNKPQPQLPSPTPGNTQSASTQPSASTSPYEGKLVYDGNPKVYLVQDGKKRWVPDWATYQALLQSGYPERIKISTQALNQIPLGITL
jgi:hypothetical protein